MDVDNNILETALNTVAARAPSHDTPDGGRLVLVPPGYRTETVAPLEPKLSRIRQDVTLHDRDSFVAYVNRFKSDATRIFAEPGFIASDDRAHVVAVMDYHAPGGVDHAVHSATYTPRYSEQWRRWTAVCERPLKQAEFAEFIEEVRADIVDPDAARLLDIVRTFKASKKVEFDSLTYQSDGSVKLVYDEKTQQSGSSGALPEQMKIGIPVYFRGAPYAVSVLVRYRVGQGAVMFHLKIDRADVVEDVAFSDITKAIGEATGIDCYLGRR